MWFGTHLEVAEEWRRGQVERNTWDDPDRRRADLSTRG